MDAETCGEAVAKREQVLANLKMLTAALHRSLRSRRVARSMGGALSRDPIRRRVARVRLRTSPQGPFGSRAPTGLHWLL